MADGVRLEARGLYNCTVLMAAQWNSNPEIKQVLVDAGADVNASDNAGVTPLMIAAKYTNEAVTADAHRRWR